MNFSIIIEKSDENPTKKSWEGYRKKIISFPTLYQALNCAELDNGETLVDIRSCEIKKYKVLFYNPYQKKTAQLIYCDEVKEIKEYDEY